MNDIKECEHPHQWAQVASALCIEKVHGADGITIDVVREAVEEVVTDLIEQMQRDFDEKILLLQETINTLANERDKLIDSCWY